MNAPDEVLSAAASDLDQGEAMAALERLEPYQEDADACLLLSEALLALGEVPMSLQAFEKASSALDPEQPDVIWMSAELHLASWSLELAIEEYQRYLALEPSVGAHMRLALAYDALGQFDHADAQEKQALALEPELEALVRLTESEFDATVEAALADLRRTHPIEVERVFIATEPMPHRGMIDPSLPHATPPDLLGLFSGPTLADLADTPGAELPPTIHLFQRNLERMGLPGDELRAEIRTTLFHEFGHLLGLDEEGVAALGLA